MDGFITPGSTAILETQWADHAPLHPGSRALAFFQSICLLIRFFLIWERKKRLWQKTQSKKAGKVKKRVSC